MESLQVWKTANTSFSDVDTRDLETQLQVILGFVNRENHLKAQVQRCIIRKRVTGR